MSLVLEYIEKYLGAKGIDAQVYLYKELDSTNTRAIELASEGAPHGTVVIADRQTKGRGRFERRWISPAGTNLHMSILLRPPEVVLRSAGVLTFMAAVAVVRSIKRLEGPDAAIKWPNDVLLNGKKVAGILAEQADSLPYGKCVVLGVGVNLNQTYDSMPIEIRDTATSFFAATGRMVNRSLFSAWLIDLLGEIYRRILADGCDAVIEPWREHNMTLGRRIRLMEGSRIIEGEAEDVDGEGGLLVRTDHGEHLRVFSGDVTVL